MINVRQVILLAQVIAALYCTGAVADTSLSIVTTSGVVRKADCIDFINENPARVSCGFIDLPSDHDANTQRTVSIPILIAEQTRSIGTSDRAILIPGGGGPGASVGFGYPSAAGEYLEYFASLRAAGFDIIVVDQRGAGFSKPALRCKETVSDFKTNSVNDLPLSAAIASYQNAVSACIERLLNSGVQPSDFDTYQSARDFISVMETLPYKWWGTLATSYATAIAQAMEIIKPQTFNRIVLDSPVPMDYQQPYTIESSRSAIMRILNLCEQTRRCNRKHRNIKQKFSAVLSRVKNKPYSVTAKIYDESEDESDKIFVVNDITLLDILVIAAYSNYYIAEIPYVIDQLYKKRPSALKEITQEYWYANTDLDYAEGLSWTVHCKERQPLEDEFKQQNTELENTYSDESRLILQQEGEVCKMWDVGTTTNLRAKKQLLPETLIIAGDLDPVISHNDINNTTDDFINHQVTVVAGMGHSVWYQSECTRQQVASFFAHDEKTFTLEQCRDGITRFK